MNGLGRVWERARRGAGGLVQAVDRRLQSFIRRPWLELPGAPLRPAEVGDQLRRAMLADRNVLEDAHYVKTVPNDFLVELNPAQYESHFRPLHQQIVEQWTQLLLEEVSLTNQRQGRREYRFAGPVRIRVQPAADVRAGRGRLGCWVRPTSAAQPAPAGLAHVELLPGGRQWGLREGLTTIGRDEGCDIWLDMPRFQEQPLISGQHAYIVGQGQLYRLFDGKPGGPASRNGTYVNGRPVAAGGQALKDGDLIVLAAVDPNNPRPDRPGVAAFLFSAVSG